MRFEPDIDYVIDLIAFAYDSVTQALEQDDLDRAEYWQDYLELLVHNLRCYLARTL